jgi:methionine biosynthesis protein MetW
MSTATVENNGIRYDLQIVASWIHPGARVLSLGCGEGDLLYYLKRKKDAACTGIEIDEARVARCIERGLTVLQGDINEEVRDYPSDMFDYVILSQTLQQIYEPADLIKSIMRIGRRAVVSFPNFSHWKNRLQLLLKGIAPVSRQLPYQWHDTPNIRVITIKDFKRYAGEMGFKILKDVAINTNNQSRSGNIITLFPNLRASYGIFLIGKESG